MPVMVKKSPKAQASAPKGQAAVNYIYPDLSIMIDGKLVPIKGCRLSIAQAKTILGWTTEEDYNKQAHKENPKAPKDKVFKFPENWPVIVEPDGTRVVCMANIDNRPFRSDRAKRLMQKILKRQWAGAENMPGETVNGETILIDRDGKVRSGQHRLIALIWAVEAWLAEDKDGKWHTFWPDEPYLESLVVYGISGSPRIVATIDDVETRDLTDIVHTSPLFQSAEPYYRAEGSRMLAKALGLFWKRTGISDLAGSKYLTQQEGMDVCQRHPKLLECVEIVYRANKKRGLSTGLKLSPGNCATLLYLAGCSATAKAIYYKADKDSLPRSEENLDWSRLEKAKEFFQALGDGKFPAVSGAMALIIRDYGGKLAALHHVLARAWGVWLKNGELTEPDVFPSENDILKDANGDPITDDHLGHKFLKGYDPFGGIDLGEKAEVDEDDIEPGEPTRTEREDEARKIKGQNLETEAVGDDETPTQEKARREKLENLKQMIAERKAEMSGKNGEVEAPKLKKSRFAPSNKPAGKTGKGK